MTACKLCGQQGELRRSHIIPRSFIHEIKGDSKSVNAVMRRDYRPVEIHQSGIWDAEILCGECEGSLSPWDTYGFEVFGSPPGSNNLIFSAATDYAPFILHDIDYRKLKLFVLSVLWRASATTHPFFDGVSLGSHESRIGELIRSREPGNPEDYAVVVFRLIHQPPKHERLIYPPWQQEIDGANFCCFYLPSLRICVKIGDSPMPPDLQSAILRPGRDIFLIPAERGKAEHFFLNAAAQTIRRRFPDRFPQQSS